MKNTIQENRFQIKQHTILTWIALTIEILVTSLAYTGLNILGASRNNSILITFFIALLPVVLGLLFIYQVYPRFTQKPSVKVSLFEDYVTLTNKKDEKESPFFRNYHEWFENVWYKSTPLSECYTSLMRSYFSDHFIRAFPLNSNEAGYEIKFVYEDIEGKHLTIVIDNQNKKMTLYVLSKLTSEVKESQFFAVEQKQEQIGLIDQITKEAFKPKPNRTLLTALIDGLISVFRGSPGMNKAAADASSLTSLLNTPQV